MSRAKRPPPHSCAPAFLAGTSAEYLGRKPWPRVIRERQVIFVLGPEGSGKTQVARRMQAFTDQNAKASGEGSIYFDSRALQHAVLDRVRNGYWAEELRLARSLVLDGPVWLRNRAGLVDLLVELLRERDRERRRTIVCQSDNDGSIEALIGAMDVGSIVVVALRFPKGRRGRLNFARRVCDDLGIPREAARGTEAIEPWGYDAVAEHLRSWPAVGHEASRVCDPWVDPIGRGSK